MTEEGKKKPSKALIDFWVSAYRHVPRKLLLEKAMRLKWEEKMEKGGHLPPAIELLKHIDNNKDTLWVATELLLTTLDTGPSTYTLLTHEPVIQQIINSWERWEEIQRIIDHPKLSSIRTKLLHNTLELKLFRIGRNYKVDGWLTGKPLIEEIGKILNAIPEGEVSMREHTFLAALACEDSELMERIRPNIDGISIVRSAAVLDNSKLFEECLKNPNYEYLLPSMLNLATEFEAPGCLKVLQKEFQAIQSSILHLDDIRQDTITDLAKIALSEWGADGVKNLKQLPRSEDIWDLAAWLATKRRFQTAAKVLTTYKIPTSHFMTITTRISEAHHIREFLNHLDGQEKQAVLNCAACSYHKEVRDSINHKEISDIDALHKILEETLETCLSTLLGGMHADSHVIEHIKDLHNLWVETNKGYGEFPPASIQTAAAACVPLPQLEKLLKDSNELAWQEAAVMLAASGRTNDLETWIKEKKVQKKFSYWPVLTYGPSIAKNPQKVDNGLTWGACCGNSPNTIRMLLSHGIPASCSIPGLVEDTAGLWIASHHPEIAEILVENLPAKAIKPQQEQNQKQHIPIGATALCWQTLAKRLNRELQNKVISMEL